jgi:hypothetical protein
MTTAVQSAIITTLTAAAAIGLALAFEPTVAGAFAKFATMLEVPK